MNMSKQSVRFDDEPHVDVRAYSPHYEAVEARAVSLVDMARAVTPIGRRSPPTPEPRGGVGFVNELVGERAGGLSMGRRRHAPVDADTRASRHTRRSRPSTGVAWSKQRGRDDDKHAQIAGGGAGIGAGAAWDDDGGALGGGEGDRLILQRPRDDVTRPRVKGGGLRWSAPPPST